jgi:leucyl-tRNA synthetase
VGHVEGYTATDIYSRYKRMKGFNVLHPMGWDSFGLPAEKYAIRTGTHPARTTELNIQTYRRQLKSLGFSYDWSREIATSDPSYYKWTQWIFTLLHKKGLAYEAEATVNYCPMLGTVLANEEVDEGKSKEEGYDVIRVPLRQWILKITAYSEELIKDLDLVDWPQSLKMLQRNWIGRSEGATIYFPIEGTNESLSVFTTRADTLLGATYVALAPEHPFVDRFVTEERRPFVVQYQKEAQRKTDLERTELAKEKTGVWTGGYVLHPITKEKIPVWVAEYVLSTYGSGAVMAVPAHDQRDFEFAAKYSLPVKNVIRPTDGTIPPSDKAFTEDGMVIGGDVFSISLKDMSSEDARKCITNELEKRSLAKNTIHYKLRDWLFSRQRYWGEPIPILHFDDGTMRALEVDELPLLPPMLEDFKPTGDGKSPLARVDSWVNAIDPKTGKPARRETNTMPQWAGSCWYYLRFIDPKNDTKAWSLEKEKYWLPVDLYVGGVEHAVLHLLYARFWHKVLFDCGLVSHSEPFLSLRNQGLIVSRSFKTKNNTYVSAEDVKEAQGVYTHKTTGEILTSQVEKMSKSKLNGITPDDIIQSYGSDALRLYEMFMGPLEKEKVWNTDAVAACRRFLVRIYTMVTSGRLTDTIDLDTQRLMHKLIHKAESDLEALQFNTTIAKMMEFVNEISQRSEFPKQALETLVLILSSFAPHISEEMWNLLGHTTTIAYEPFPKAEARYLIDEVVTYVIQINGKLRERVDLSKDKSEKEIIEEALACPNVQRFLDGKVVKKTIFVPQKLLNFVV